MDEKINSMDEKINSMDARMDSMDVRMDSMDARMDSIEFEVKKIAITQENDVLPRLQNIESCYISTFTRYQESVDDYQGMKDDISLLKHVVADHSKKLQKIS